VVVTLSKEVVVGGGCSLGHPKGVILEAWNCSGSQAVQLGSMCRMHGRFLILVWRDVPHELWWHAEQQA
jgi:hypothetical protein